MSDARRVVPFLVALGAFSFAISRAPSDPDMYWHLASARWMVDHGALLTTDVFSSTAAGQPYSVGEWLGQLVLYASYSAAGWAGLALLRGVLVAIEAFFVTYLAVRSQPRLAIAVPIAIAAIVLSSILWTDRPNLFSFALFPALYALLVEARAGRLRLLFVVPPLMLVWSDLHGGYALGVVLVALFTVEAIVTRGAWRSFAVATALAAVATLLDPGAFGFGAALAHAGAPPRFIVEESPPDVLTPAGALFAAFVLATIAIGMRAGGTVLDALVLLPLLWLGFSAQRDMPYYAFAAVPYLASGIPRAIAVPTWRVRTPRGTLVGASVGVAIVAVFALTAIPRAPDERAYPTGAVALLDQTRGALLNEYDWGGFLIWRAPSHPVFIDGRLLPFVPRVMADWEEAVRLGPSYRDVLQRYGIGAVLLRPDRALAGALREDGWRVLGETDRWVLLSRP